jgi:hypothetical protein
MIFGVDLSQKQSFEMANFRLWDCAPQIAKNLIAADGPICVTI